MAYNVIPPLAQASVAVDGLVLQTRHLLAKIGQSIEINIPFEDIERVRSLGNGVIVYVNERLFPIETSLGPLTGWKRRRYSRVVITIPDKSARKTFISSLERSLAGRGDFRGPRAAVKSTTPFARAATVDKRRALLVPSVQLAIGVIVLVVFLLFPLTGVAAADIAFAFLLGLPLILHAVDKLYRYAKRTLRQT
ncbi:MAG: hypothetical protein ABSC51_08665 [Gaiellaceae bacterium]|jgi:hypothetical protein